MIDRDDCRRWSRWEARREAVEEGFASAFASFVFFCACVLLAYWIGGYFTLP